MHSEACCNDPACVNAVTAAASAEASQLSITERQIILDVLKRNEQLHKDQQYHILRLQAELQILRQKGAIRVDDPTGPDPDRSCGRCRTELGRVINRGATCRACRLKVCKNCRIYYLTGSEWVCTVCHKYMEIQAATGEWMNEFVRRPSRRRDNRVYNPSTDIIKRSIRRSWTISSPSMRWSFMRPTCHQEFRPYSSLPRCNDFNSYPSLIVHHKQQQHPQTEEKLRISSIWRRHSPIKSAQSEEVYPDQTQQENEQVLSELQLPHEITCTSPKPRVNPLIKYASERKTKFEISSDSDASDNDDPLKAMKSKRKLQHAKSDGGGSDSTRLNVKKPLESSKSEDGTGCFGGQEKRVSFSKESADCHTLDNDGSRKDRPIVGTTTGAAIAARTETQLNDSERECDRKEERDREELPIELCDIESISGTVFRKVTVRRRRQDMRKMPAVDTGWRRAGAHHDPDLLDTLLPEGDDYKLVFISSDSSSKEEDPDDNDSTTTSSSFPIDECDWDYFEPGGSSSGKPMLSWSTSPFGSPRVGRKTIESPLGSPLVYRRSVRESGTDTGTDEDIVRFDTQSPSSSSSRDVEDREHVEEKVREPAAARQTSDDASLQCVRPEAFEATPQRQACQNCGMCGGSGTTQYVPIPVPVPIPIPVPQWQPQELIVYTPETLEALRNQLRQLPRAFYSYLNQAAVLWPLLNVSESNMFMSRLPKTQSESSPHESQLKTSSTSPNSLNSSEPFKEEPKDGNSEMQTLESDEDYDSSNSDDSDSSQNEADGKVAKRKSSKMYIVNDMSENSSSDIEESGDIVLTKIKALDEDAIHHNITQPVIGSDIEADCDRECDLNACDDKVAFKNGGDHRDDVAGAADDVFASKQSPIVEDASSECNTIASIRSGEPVTDSMAGTTSGADSRAGGTPRVATVGAQHESRAGAIHATNNARYTSLIMITQDTHTQYASPVSVVTSDTTRLVASSTESDNSDIVVRHTNWQEKEEDEMTANNEECEAHANCDGNNTVSQPPVTGDRQTDTANAHNGDVTLLESDADTSQPEQSLPDNLLSSNVTVITGGDTLSAVVCLEEGLADDDSWVEDLSHDDQDFDDSNDSSSGEEILQCTVAIDHEDELRGYHRTAIDFTLHTIVEESCEESEVETLPTTPKKQRPQSATDLEKYYFFGLGDGIPIQRDRDDAISETSSLCSESIDSYVGAEEGNERNETLDPAELASSRLEKYFLSGFTSFKAERRDSDGSVGSDSEGKPSPEQRRKKLVRARGTGRSHSSSLDNLIVSNPDLSNLDANDALEEDSSSSDSDTYDESNFDKADGQFDTVKRKNKNKKRNGSSSPSEECTTKLESTQEVNEDIPSEDEGHKTPQPIDLPPFSSDFNNRNKQQSRDSGFIGSNDDLIKDTRESDSVISDSKSDAKLNLYNISEEKRPDERITLSTPPPSTALTRKDSFNNWSSDEETNLMMCKMRQFFKTMVATNNSKPSTPIMGAPRELPRPMPSPRMKNRCKPPQLVYFENELTRLMKTVPGIRDDQVREIVEYLSSEDTWSDSYDSSDYTSSDLEGTTGANKSVLQQQISDSCKQIINKFDTTVDGEGDEGDGGILEDAHGLNRETAFVYQKLVASFEKIATGANDENKTNSPPLIAKVMHHIGSRLVALMHEVSSGESHASNSPKQYQRYHRRLQQKLSSASTTTTEDDDSTSDSNLNEKLSTIDDTSYNILPRSRSHDLLVSRDEGRAHHQSVSDIAEEREASDCERFSWRGSFESALLATDSRNKLSLIGGEGSASASALAIAAKRRSAGDLLFSNKSLSREQLDRVRSCGSIGGANSEDKLWVASGRPSRRRSSVPDASCGSGGSADGEDELEDEEELENRSTLPRSLQTCTPTTNSLPRLPTNTQMSNMQKAQSMYHVSQSSVKSARYRPPGFNRLVTSSVPKRAVSAPGLQPTPQRRGRRQQPTSVAPPTDDIINITDVHSSPKLTPRITKSASPSPVVQKTTRSLGVNQEWHSNEEDIDRLVAIHSKRNSLSNLGTRSDSMASVYSGAGEGRYGTVAVKGQVEFGLQYNYKAGALEINVKQCRDLAAVDAKRNRSDPYVKVYLLPDKSKSGKRKTKVKKHTLNPVFDECLKFHMSLTGLETRTLWLTVWHSDMFGRNDFLGEVMMTLENKVFDDPSPIWYNLQERTEPFDDLSFKGDILVGLKFVPPDMTVHKKGKRSRGSLHVLVKEAKALTAVKANGTSDPFCKSYLLPDKGRHSKQKTSVIRRTVNPIWNHTFVYDDVTLQELAERCLELTIWDHDRLASNEFIGGVRFSLGTGKTYGKSVDWMDATGKELTLWKSMLERPNFWVEGCVSLRPTLEHRAT